MTVTATGSAAAASTAAKVVSRPSTCPLAHAPACPGLGNDLLVRALHDSRLPRTRSQKESRKWRVLLLCTQPASGTRNGHAFLYFMPKPLLLHG